MKSDEILDKIRNKFKNVDPNNRTVLNVFQFNVTNHNGVILKRAVIDCKDLIVFDLAANADDQANVDALVTISDDDLYAIGTKVSTFEELLTAKKIRVEGDTEAIQKMLEKFRGK